MTERWSLKDRVVIVTGGSQGIGAAIVEAVIADGAVAWIADLPTAREQAEALAARLGRNAHVVDCDVRLDESVSAAVSKVEAEGAPIYSLVNNAGIVGVGGFMAPLDEYRRQWETNTLGPIRMTQAVLPGMLQRKEGVVVQIASLGSLLVPNERAAYAVSKHGVLAVAKILCGEFAASGIRAVSICPNRVSVPAAHARAMKSPRDYADMHGTQQSGHMLEPDEIGHLVQSVLKPGFRGWNGDTITISDGATCTLRQASFAEGKAPVMPE